MAIKKILVVYFSRTGHTQMIAEEISKKLGSDTQEIKAIKPYSTGFFGFQKALLDATFKRTPDINVIPTNLSKYDLIIIGSPVWGGSLSAPVRSFLAKYKTQVKDLAFFTTQGGTIDREKILKQIFEASGKSSVGFMSLSEKEIKNEEYKKRIQTFIKELGIVETPLKKYPESYIGPQL
jgi:flavodoxin